MTTAYPIRPISDSEFPAFYAVIEHAFNSSWPSEPELQHELPIDRVRPDAGRVRRVPDGRDRRGLYLPDDGPGRHRHGGRGQRDRRAALTPAPRDPVQPDAAPAGRRPRPRGGRRGAVLRRVRHLRAVRLRPGLVRAGVHDPPRGERNGTSGPGRTQEAPRLRIAEPQDANGVLARVYDHVQRSRPGMLARDERWWDYTLWDPEHRRSGSSPLRCVLRRGRQPGRAGTRCSRCAGLGRPGHARRRAAGAGTDGYRPGGLRGDLERLLTRDLVAEVRAHVTAG